MSKRDTYYMKLADLESLARDLRTLGDQLAAQVDTAKAHPDPFAAQWKQGH